MNNHTLAVIFPGQSAQHIGMLSSLSDHYTLVKKTVSEVSEVLGYDMWRLMQYGPVSQLNKTCYSQPAILTASVIIWKIWLIQGGAIPNIMAGHSLGEYSALVCAKSIDLLSAVKLVEIRGILMQQATPFGCGAMSVIIGLDKNIILEFCQSIESQLNQIVAPSVFNSDKNIVISGHTEAVNQVSLLCKKSGAKYVLKLPISVPSHCNLMKSITNKFKEELEKITISPPVIPIINNVDINIEVNPEAIRSALIRQLYMPVRWQEIIQKIINKNIKKILEMGPGKILTRLMHYSTENKISCVSINDIHSLSEAIQTHIG